MMEFAAATSTAADHTEAVDEVVTSLLDQLGDTPDLVICFFSMDHAPAASGIALSLSERLGTAAIVGCTAQAVIGGRKEYEGSSGLSLWAARLPGVAVRPFALRVVEVADGYGVTGWPGFDDDARATVLLLADGFSFPADRFLERLNEEQPGLPVVGGMASGGDQPGRHRLLVGTEVLQAGAVGVGLVGPVEVRTVVSQGCRPIGSPYAVTRGEGNVVEELGGQPAVERLRQTVSNLTAQEQLLVRGGLHVGQVIDEHKAEFGRGDFLIRGLVGADPETGAIAVGDAVELGQTLQFHVRDAGAADEDLRLLLDPVASWNPRSVLLFSCNGRGRGFFGQPDHDAAQVAKATGDVPLAGFFAQGELGPVGKRNFVHGYTASVAVFCERSGPPHEVAELAETMRLPGGTEVDLTDAPPADLPPPTVGGEPEPV
ncbi:MAG TPA: FIST N-terminal domain-containing protein [Actinomycetota bacterium]|jgi:small ligand-binding sensory domain FIST